jgi:pyridoxamine 5'-phosphate oxidase
MSDLSNVPAQCPAQLPEHVLQRFTELLAQAKQSGELEPTAMTVASADANGRISARTVLLKGFDARGFVFYTNFESNKGRQLQAKPRAALLFLWKAMIPNVADATGSQGQVQVKVEGLIEVVSNAEADAYFASRARDSQLGAWASLQSQTLPTREALAQRMQECEQRFAGADVPRPPHWSGFRVRPDMIEFWTGGAHRLHERERFECVAGLWQSRSLYP